MNDKEKAFFEMHLALVDSTADQLSRSLALLKEDHPKDIRERMIEALGSELQQLYTGFEELGKTLLRAKGIYLKKVEAHHQIALEHIFDHILAEKEELRHFWADLLGFRHFFRNAYGRQLRPGEIVEKAREAGEMWPATKAELLAAAGKIFKAE